MQKKLIFIIGPPRSGSTLLQRMLGLHNSVMTHPEPHIITPLAHLGYYENVDKAPYDHINATQAIREFVEDLPSKEHDYLDACRAYTNTLYGKMLDQSGKKLFLDKTPAYALVLPFLTKLYPDAHYLVLTRHPLAIFSSYANSFFDGDYEAAVSFNNILGRYIPAMARFLRQDKIGFIHVRYEDLVSAPEQKLAEIFSFLGLPEQLDVIDYGLHKHLEKSYGDPKVKHRTRPTKDSVDKWANELGSDPYKLETAKKVIRPIDEGDFITWGYDKTTLFDPITYATNQPIKKDTKWLLNSYRLKRKFFLRLRKNIHRNRFGKMVQRIKYYCDVLLRE